MILIPVLAIVAGRISICAKDTEPDQNTCENLMEVTVLKQVKRVNF